MRIILFGGGGFIGSAIWRRVPDAVAPEHREVDLLDEEAVRRTLLPGDVVINAAGYAHATDRSAAGLKRLQLENVEAVRSLARAAAGREVSQLIHLSSVAAMGRRVGTMLAEDDVAEPRTPYARSKRAAEDALRAAGRDLPITILRPTSVFGPGRGLAATLCRVAQLPVIPMPAGGRTLVPFCYVDNVAAAVAVAIGNERCLGRTFIVGDEHSYPLRAILLGLARAMGRRQPRSVPVPLALMRGMGAVEARLARLRGRLPLLDESRLATLTTSVSYSTAAFREATGFSPPIPFTEALHRLAAAHTAARR